MSDDGSHKLTFWSKSTKDEGNLKNIYNNKNTFIMYANASHKLVHWLLSI